MARNMTVRSDDMIYLCPATKTWLIRLIERTIVVASIKSNASNDRLVNDYFLQHVVSKVNADLGRPSEQFKQIIKQISFEDR